MRASLRAQAEWWSFPSGHSMRAGYAGVMLCSLQHSPLPLLGIEVSGRVETLTLLWVLSVGLSRVALAKHFPLDVLGGLCLGAAIGLSWYPSEPANGPWRLAFGAIFSAEALAILAVPQWRALITGNFAVIAVSIMFWVTLPFAG